MAVVLYKHGNVYDTEPQEEELVVLPSSVTLRVKQDVTAEVSIDSQNTGLKLWNAAYVLAMAMCDPDVVPSEDLIGKHVVELGAGTALVSLAACSMGAVATATDMSTVLEHMQTNVESNLAAATESGVKLWPCATVIARELLWGDDAAAAAVVANVRGEHLACCCCDSGSGDGDRAFGTPSEDTSTVDVVTTTTATATTATVTTSTSTTSTPPTKQCGWPSLIVCADLIFEPDYFPDLLATLKFFLSSSDCTGKRTTALLAYTVRGLGEAEFFAAAAREGMSVEPLEWRRNTLEFAHLRVNLVRLRIFNELALPSR